MKFIRVSVCWKITSYSRQSIGSSEPTRCLPVKTNHHSELTSYLLTDSWILLSARDSLRSSRAPVRIDLNIQDCDDQSSPATLTVWSTLNFPAPFLHGFTQSFFR